MIEYEGECYQEMTGRRLAISYRKEFLFNKNLAKGGPAYDN